MKLLLLCLFVGTLALPALALPSDRKCEEGSTTNDGCNQCVCRNGAMICTEKACLPDWLQNRTGAIPDGAQCTPGSRWKIECNWCNCGPTGVPLCPKRACPPGFQQDPNESACEEGSTWKSDDCNVCRCIRGKPACSRRICASATQEDPVTGCGGVGRWRIGCNWCRCSEGRGLCTRRGCTPALSALMQAQPECEGEVSFKRECNSCSCVGGRAICTAKFCGALPATPDIKVSVTREDVQVTPVEPEGECTEGSRWRKECNWCTCNQRGMGLCTKKGCSPGILEQMRGEPECEGTARWKKDCNWCNCVDGRGICTLKACMPDESHPPTVSDEVNPVRPLEFEAVCTNGSRWRMDCNWCNCNERGIAMCTLKGCPPEIMEELRDEPECEGISRWKNDCNWCNCVDGRGVCTLKACEQDLSRNEGKSLLGRSERKCTAGSGWKKSCNWCRCSKDGFGLCTKIGCPTDYKAPVGEPQCIDGSRWKEDCNWCDCVEGRKVCTEIACGITKEDSATCVEGETFKQDCNTCTCRDGLAICTKIACSETPPMCREGSSWVEDCNRCRCANGMKLCTKRSCSNPSLPKRCRLPSILPEAPLCAGFEPMWTYDSASSECKNIVYGGCGGTKNLFASEADCISSCFSPYPSSMTRTGDSSSGSNPNTWKALSESQRKCLLPMDQGPCFGALPRFFYNKELGRCEDFSYGGCQGNENRFQTAEECQQTCGGVAPATDEACDRMLCPWKRWEHYMAKGCLPQYDGGACCPTSFLCPSHDESVENKSQCVYRNKIYELGSTVEVRNECSARCLCSPYGTSQIGEIQCVSIECPELFNPPEPGCRPLYRPGYCCPYDYECDSKPVTPTCSWNNTSYQEGDEMYFEGICQKCICGSDFTDPFGPGCKKIDCGFEFRYTAQYEKGCVPVFHKDSCCAIDWLCPDDDRIVETALQVLHDASGVNACLLSKNPGSCHNDVMRIYYDAEASECRQFVYGGCQGNGNNFRTFEECQESCSKTPKPSESECQVGGLVSAGPSEPQNVRVTALLNSGYPGRMSLQVEWSAPNCPRGDIKGYKVWVQALSPIEKPHVDTSITSKLTGPLITQLVTGGLYLQQSYVIAVAAENNHGLSKLSPLVVFSLIPNYRRPDQCHLGSISLEVGRSLKISNCELDCRCITPPEFTCVEYESCEEVTREQSYKDCPEMQCNAECMMLTDTLTGCLKCSCHNKSFTCPDPECPPLCQTTINYETGCPSCDCQCPLDASGQPPCPEDCEVKIVTDTATGCQRCECDSSEYGRSLIRGKCPQNPPCPADCGVHMMLDRETGCVKCECDPNQSGNPFGALNCPQYPGGRPPCPMDCAVKQTKDPVTGCAICICDPNNTDSPFVPITFPQAPSQNNCYKNRDGRPPCPADCAIKYITDTNTGCELCICDPNNTGNPFGPFVPPPPPPSTRCPDGPAPCPQDCGVIRKVDATTGCEVCICDPNDTSNPFGPFVPPPPPPSTRCSDGPAPCPQDCAIIRKIDATTGCEVCTCDPNNPGSPFGPFVPPPPPPSTRCSDGPAPCPQDCAVIRKVDATTGCEVCTCDPNDSGNPFGPFVRPPPPPGTRCPTDSDGRAPCPQDCAVIRKVDATTGCEVCICDPNDRGNPFGPFVRPPPPPGTRCPTDSDGRAPCPQDCAVIRRVDATTGCEVCTCDPNNPGSPFEPFLPPPPPPSTRR